VAQATASTRYTRVHVCARSRAQHTCTRGRAHTHPHTLSLLVSLSIFFSLFPLHNHTSTHPPSRAHATTQTEFTDITAHLKEVADLVGSSLFRCLSGDLKAEYEVGGADAKEQAEPGARGGGNGGGARQPPRGRRPPSCPLAWLSATRRVAGLPFVCFIVPSRPADGPWIASLYRLSGAQDVLALTEDAILSPDALDGSGHAADGAAASPRGAPTPPSKDSCGAAAGALLFQGVGLRHCLVPRAPGCLLNTPRDEERGPPLTTPGDRPIACCLPPTQAPSTAVAAGRPGSAAGPPRPPPAAAGAASPQALGATASAAAAAPPRMPTSWAAQSAPRAAAWYLPAAAASQVSPRTRA
jgi:hypothetical protein